MYNYLSKELRKPVNREILIENYTKILILLNPFIPHFSSECLHELNKLKKIDFTSWPEIEKKYLEEKEVIIVVQINGKKREIIKTKKDTSEIDVLKIVNDNYKINNYIKNKKVIKKIFVPNKILNLIIK